MSLSPAKKGSIAAGVIGGAVGIIASMIPDAAINGELTWSWIVAAGVVYALGLAIPAIWSPRRGWILSLVWMSAGLLPFLLCIEWVCNRYLLEQPAFWFGKMALPLGVIWLAAVWLVLLFAWMTKRVWYTAAWACLLAGVGSFITNMLAADKTWEQMWSSLDTLINTGAFVLLIILFVVIGVYRRQKRV